MGSEEAAKQPSGLVQVSWGRVAAQSTADTVVAEAKIALNEKHTVTTPAVAGHASTPLQPTALRPRLFVDWGEPPRVGHQCRPDFVLWCPTDLGFPDVEVTLDKELDSQMETPRARLQSDGSGLWNFNLPFQLTTQGVDCRPGQYLLELSVTLNQVGDPVPRFFRAQIRLNVGTNRDGQGGILEIDGDGQSLVNLQGYDLRQFSKIVLKGGQDGVINLANTTCGPPAAVAPIVDDPPTSFEYELKLDQTRQTRLPVLRQPSRPRSYMDAACFTLGDDQQVLVVAKARLTLGRSRDNDVVLRFLPQSADHDRYSASLSRTHVVMELTADGLQIEDKSKCGTEINSQMVAGRHMVSAGYVGESLHMELGVTAPVSRPLELELFLLGPSRRETDGDTARWDEFVCEIAGGKLSRSGRLAIQTGIDAIRLERRNNLAGRETYVQLYREVLIGGSSARCGIVLPACASGPQARLRHIDRGFWLETLPLSVPILVDGQLLNHPTLIPLSPGQEIVIGSEVLRFGHPSQLHLQAE